MKRYINMAVAVIFLVFVTLVLADNARERRFIWDEANTKMASARTAGEFLHAAETYRKLVDAGVRNGHLFYNLGTALLMAEQYDEAMTFLLRAERYLGSSWEIRRNMMIAMARGEKDRPVSLPWYRFPLFWHYGLAGSTRLAIAVAAFGFFWLALILRALGVRGVCKPLVVLSLIAIVLFGSSAATTFQQEARIRREPTMSGQAGNRR